MRSIVVRCDQRANSRTIAISAFLEIDGHAIPKAAMHAAVSSSDIGSFDQAAIGMLVTAIKSAVKSAGAELPLAGGWA